MNNANPEILENYTISDHYPIKMELKMGVKKAIQRKITTEYYDTRNFDKEKFGADLRIAFQKETHETLSSAIERYNRVLVACFKEQCPEKVKAVKETRIKSQKWYNEKVILAKRHKRRLERKMK